MRACFEAGVPWVARGAGTGLSGGALPVAEGMLIVLARLRRILSVDLEDSRVVVEPGVTNLAISRAVAPTHFYPPDPSSQIVCSIGGNVAENSGGAHCFKYGFTTNYVTGLEVVLSDGTVVELDRDAPGYDLLGAFVGSEGTLGVATRITLRVVPRPETTRTLVAFFDDTAQAGDAVTAIVAAGIVPGAIEMMDRLSIRAAEAGDRRRLPARRRRRAAGRARRARARSATARFEHVIALCSASRRPRRARAADERERELIWKARKAAFAAMGRIAPAYYVQDGVIPRTRLSEVLRRIDALAAEYELQVANVFHAGDGNLHPLVCYDAARRGRAGARRGARRADRQGVRRRRRLDHRRARRRRRQEGATCRRCSPRPTSTRSSGCAVRSTRTALANPGKVMPTPRLCGEVPGPYREHPLERAGVAVRF